MEIFESIRFYISTYPKETAILCVVLTVFIVLNRRANMLLALTSDGRSILRLAKEIESKLGFKREFRSLFQIDEQASISLKGRVEGQAVFISIKNHLVSTDLINALTTDIRSHMKGITVIVRVNEKIKHLSKEEITLDDVKNTIRDVLSSERTR